MPKSSKVVNIKRQDEWKDINYLFTRKPSVTLKILLSSAFFFSFIISCLLLFKYPYKNGAFMDDYKFFKRKEINLKGKPISESSLRNIASKTERNDRETKLSINIDKSSQYLPSHILDSQQNNFDYQKSSTNRNTFSFHLSADKRVVKGSDQSLFRGSKVSSSYWIIGI